MGLTQDAGGAARAKFFPTAATAKPCNYCKSAAALLFCHHHSAFLCIPCDSKAHDSDINKHERVWMCEVCEQAPAAVTCKADAAALCATCDRDIHAANPLAGRHDRVPVVPFYDATETVVMKSAAATSSDEMFVAAAGEGGGRKVEEGFSCIPDPWIAMNSIVTPKIAQVETTHHDLKAIELLFEDSEQFLEFENYQISSQPYSDSVVPVQAAVKPPISASPETRFEIDFTRSNINSYSSYTPPSLSHSVSSSSMDVGVVPDGGSVSDISFPFARNVSSTVDLGGNQGSQVAGLDREARVLRYKEKRKNRKFEKTIRYASRKAYAETRPRIKGRFAKRTDTESDMERIFGAGSGHYISEARYGVVPSF